MTYQSRLLQSLDQQIQQCTNHNDLARLVSRRAIHLARLNSLEESKAEIGQLRVRLGKELGAESGAWIFLAEGVIAYYSFDLNTAFDRLQRSYAVAKSTGQTDAIAIIASWLAHITAEQRNKSAAIDYAITALNAAKEDNHAALSRLSQTIGMLFGDADLISESQKWFAKARSHAVAEGDESALAAVFYNKTVHRLVNAMICDALGRAQSSDFKMLAMEVDSSNSFDEAFGSVGLQGNTSMIRGHILSITRKFDEAIIELEKTKSDTVYSFNLAVIYADLAYCLQSVGANLQTNQWLQLLQENLGNTNGSDDLAFIHGRLSQIDAMRGDTLSSQRNSKLAEEFETIYRSEQREIAIKLSAVPSADNIFR